MCQPSSSDDAAFGAVSEATKSGDSGVSISTGWFRRKAAAINHDTAETLATTVADQGSSSNRDRGDSREGGGDSTKDLSRDFRNRFAKRHGLASFFLRA